MITTSYNYSSGSGFQYDSSKIGFSGGTAKLLATNNPGLVFSQNYASGTGFTYNASNTEFVGGVLRQKAQAPAGLAAYAAWDSFLNINYGTGGSIVTAFNGAAVAAGVLNLTGATVKYVQLPVDYVMGNIGTIAFQYKPNYSGNPGGNQIMYGNIGPTNYFALLHSQSVGHLQLTITNSAGSAIINAFNFGTWNPTAGTTYTFVLQFDITNGATKLFLNGVQFGSTIATTGSRTASASAWVGSDGTPADGNANFSISGFAIYSTIVGPAGLTPLSDNNYIADTITFPTFSYSGLGHILAYTAAAVTDTNAPGYILNGRYWDGFAWVTSNNTYAQTASAANVVANIASLPLSDTVVVKMITATSINTRMSASLFSITYTGQIYPLSNPTISPTLPLTLDQLTSFVAVSSASGSDAVQFYLLIGGTNYYWSGSAWVVSDATFAQSNTAADILANAATLPIEDGVYFTPYALLHSASGLTTPTLTSLTIVYDYFGPEPVGPNVCTVFGYILDEAKNIVAGAKVTVNNPTTFFNQGIVEAQGPLVATTNSLGYFEITLAETETVSKKLTWTVVYPGTRGNFSFGKTTIPNSPTINFIDLEFSP